MAIFYGHDPKQVLSGPCLIAEAPMSTAAPSRVSDVILPKKPYTLVTGWTAYGATKDAPEYEPDWDTEDNYIDQDSSAIRRKITEFTRTLSMTLAQFTPEMSRMAEEGAAIETLAAGVAASGIGAGRAVSAGIPQSLTTRRIAVICERDLGFRGVVGVKEAAASTVADRGPFVCLFLFNSSLNPSGSVTFDHEDMATRELEVSADPDPAITDPQKNTVRWYFENDGQTLP